MIIDHDSRTDLLLELGIGNPASPDTVITLQAHQGNPDFPFNKNINQIYDVTIPDNLWPPQPNGPNTYWLRVTDTVQGNFGILRSWCLNDEFRNPAATTILCEFSPQDLTVPLDITDDLPPLKRSMYSARNYA